MNEDHAILCQQFPQEHGSLGEPLKIGIRATAPGVSICLLLYDGGLFAEIFVGSRQRRLERKILPRIKGWVYINEIYFACELRQEGRQDIFLVAPDEPVAPLGVAPAGEKFEVAPAVLSAFVDCFDCLKRERDPHRPLLLAVSVVFSFPNEFGHFFPGSADFYISKRWRAATEAGRERARDCRMHRAGRNRRGRKQEAPR